MKTEEFLDRLCEVLNRPAGSIQLTDTPETLAEWDSLGHLAIIGLVDSLFDLAVSDRSLQEFSSVEQLANSLRSQGLLGDGEQ